MDQQSESFIDSIRQTESSLETIGFSRSVKREIGHAHFVTFRRNDTTVEFLYGPPESNTEMIIHTLNGKFGLKDLLEIPEISGWMNQNRYTQTGGRSIKNEMQWNLELLKASLIFIE